ncbi:MAG: MFS transporter [Actinomycetales bacterium]
MPSASRGASLARARAAGSVVFFANGLVFASLVPRLPGIKAALELGDGAYGLVIAAAPAGALALGLLAPRVMSAAGTARVATLGMTILAALYIAAGASPEAWLFAAVMFVAGGTDAIVDVAQNTHALRLQRLYARSIITSFHAVWSLGSLAGGLLGTAAAAWQVPLVAHLAGTAVLTALVMALVSRHLLPDDDTPTTLDTSPAPTPGAPDETPPAAGTTGGAEPGATAGTNDGPRTTDAGTAGTPTRSLRPWLLLAIFAVIGTAGASVEDAGSSWAGVRLAQGLDASAGVAGLGFVLFTSGMVVGRLVGDRVVDAVGRHGAVRLGGVLVAAGMALAGLSPSVVGAIAGFALAGLGTSVLIPMAMDAADDVPGLRPGVGLTVVSWIMRAGGLFSPMIIGATAEVVGVGRALLLVAGAGLLAALASFAVPRGRRA